MNWRGVSSLALGLGVVALAAAASQRKTERRVDFAKDVEPVLRARCVSCHNPTDSQGGLDLSNRAEASRMVKPGDSKHSELLRRILGQGGKPRMPMGFAPLSARDTATLSLWIDQGAAWPEARAAGKPVHWAYATIRRPLEPPTERGGIDSFIDARLLREKLGPSPQADRTTLIRRVSLDLTGLPPTPAEVDAFLADTGSGAYGRVVDRLLASPHFGERMALPWLDAARYADSNGFQQDGDTYQYLWRDWVVDAFNKNKRFDTFTIEQLAGDLLPGATLDQQIATGFNRCHLLNGEGGAIAEEQRNVILFDRVDVTATTWLGLTLACAQCHDHKYDPLPQKDYYRFLAYFNNVPETGVPPFGGQYRIAEPAVLVASASENARLAELEKAIGGARTPETKTAATKARDDFRNALPRVMVMSDARPRKTFVLDRGNYEAPKDEVFAGTPSALPSMPATFPKNRLGLSRWLVSRDNPLTARVQVNRFWQHFFGVGLVKTSENLGVQADPPSHPELLDYLASEFQTDWDMKRLIRLIVTSDAYKRSSNATPEQLRRDPENRLLARGARFRLPSMVLRDIALSSSGLLNPKLGGKPVYPYQPAGIWDGLSITKERDFSYPQSKGSDLYRRSLYTFWRRTVAPGNMFDASSRQTCKVRASITSTPLHALTTLNDITWVEAGRALAQTVWKENPDAGSSDNRLVDAFRRVCARKPSASELAVLRRALGRARAFYAGDRKAADAYLALGESVRDNEIPAIEHAALASVCLAIYNLDEALTRE